MGDSAAQDGKVIKELTEELLPKAEALVAALPTTQPVASLLAPRTLAAVAGCEDPWAVLLQQQAAALAARVAAEGEAVAELSQRVQFLSDLGSTRPCTDCRHEGAAASARIGHFLHEQMAPGWPGLVGLKEEEEKE